MRLQLIHLSFLLPQWPKIFTLRVTHWACDNVYMTVSTGSVLPVLGYPAEKETRTRISWYIAVHSLMPNLVWFEVDLDEFWGIRVFQIHHGFLEGGAFLSAISRTTVHHIKITATVQCKNRCLDTQSARRTQITVELLFESLIVIWTWIPFRCTLTSKSLRLHVQVFRIPNSVKFMWFQKGGEEEEILFLHAGSRRTQTTALQKKLFLSVARRFVSWRVYSRFFKSVILVTAYKWGLSNNRHHHTILNNYHKLLPWSSLSVTSMQHKTATYMNTSCGEVLSLVHKLASSSW